MNKLFKIIYNHHTQSFQAVCEYGKSHTTTSSTSKPNKTSSFKAKILSVFVGGLMSSVAIASPTNGVVTAGQAVINQNELITNINQSSQNAAINWQSFNVGKNETVNFHQPNAQSVTLNRVIGNERSVIDGAMNANGKVFISNANGMLIGKNAQINVGSLVATTANISDDDFMNGRYRFAGGENGSVENLGHISVPKGGVVALVAPIVKNGGTITAHEGNVLLASADSFSITLPQDGFAYTLDKGTLQGLVDNGGAILADAGRVVLTAKGVDTVKKSLIKHSGNIEANTVQNKNGVIELLGDLDNSALNVSGSLKAEGKGDDKGGFIETSSAQLNFDDNAVISTKSETGQTGTWLIDPKDFTVAPSGGDITGAKVSEGLQSNNVTLKSRDGAKEGKGDVIINDEISWDKNTLTLNAENDIHINKTLNGTGTAKLALEYGQDIDNGSTSDYYVKNGARVNLPEGNNLTIKKGSMGQTEQFQVIHTLPTKANNYTFSHQNIAIGKHIDLSNTKSLSNFKGFNVKFDSSKIHGLGNGFSGLSIDNNDGYIGLIRKMSGGEIRDLSVVNTNVRGGDKTGALIGLANGSKIQNITVIGNVQGSNFVGGIVGDATSSKLDGLKFINGSITGSNYVGGIAGYTHNISNTIVKDSKITGTDFVGGLVGYNSGNINDSATQTLTIKGNDYVGGLVGNTTGDQVRKSYTHDSHITGNNKVGGLIGSSEYANKSYIKEVYFSNGTVTGKNNVGGLSGYDIDDIFNAYVSGTVTGENQVGGLVGDGLGYMNVRNAYFNGTINGTGKNVSNLFGVETYNYTYDKNYYNIDKTRPLGKYGQGKTLEQMKQKSTYEGWDFDTLWKIDNGKDTPRLQNIINHENLGASAATSINQAYLNNIPNKQRDISIKKEPENKEEVSVQLKVLKDKYGSWENIKKTSQGILIDQALEKMMTGWAHLGSNIGLSSEVVNFLTSQKMRDRLAKAMIDKDLTFKIDFQGLIVGEFATLVSDIIKETLYDEFKNYFDRSTVLGSLHYTLLSLAMDTGIAMITNKGNVLAVTVAEAKVVSKLVIEDIGGLIIDINKQRDDNIVLLGNGIELLANSYQKSIESNDAKLLNNIQEIYKGYIQDATNFDLDWFDALNMTKTDTFIQNTINNLFMAKVAKNSGDTINAQNYVSLALQEAGLTPKFHKAIDSLALSMGLVQETINAKVGAETINSGHQILNDYYSGSYQKNKNVLQAENFTGKLPNTNISITGFISQNVAIHSKASKQQRVSDPGKPTQNIRGGELIETFKETTIRFQDGSIIKLSPNSIIEIQKIPGKSYAQSVKLLNGTVLQRTQEINSLTVPINLR